MNIADVRLELKAIRAAAKAEDDEKAHNLEDALYVMVLTEIAYGPTTGAEAYSLAEEALKASRIKFNRYTS